MFDIVTPWTTARQASLFFTISTESVISSNYLILCCPLLLLPSIFPSIRVYFNELALRSKWPKDWSFSISPSNEYTGLISFRMDWFVSLGFLSLSAFVSLTPPVSPSFLYLVTFCVSTPLGSLSFLCLSPQPVSFIPPVSLTPPMSLSFLCLSASLSLFPLSPVFLYLTTSCVSRTSSLSHLPLSLTTSFVSQLLMFLTTSCVSQPPVSLTTSCVSQLPVSHHFLCLSPLPVSLTTSFVSQLLMFLTTSCVSQLPVSLTSPNSPSFLSLTS